MIDLQSLPALEFHCPHDDQLLESGGWQIVGIRSVIELQCPHCQRLYFADLPSGHGLYYPMLIEQETGQVINHHADNTAWFANRMQSAWINRNTVQIPYRIITYRDVTNPVILNCLDDVYGHTLLKLLNVDYHINQQHNPVLIIPKFLEWLIPDGVAEVIVVDLPLREMNLWSTDFAQFISDRYQACSHIYLSEALSHPNISRIDRFTKIKPFDVTLWSSQYPVITFIWRDDRLWSHQLLAFKNRVIKREPCTIQQDNIVALTTRLKERYPNMQFAICGIGEAGGFPDWIKDLRTTNIEVQIEHTWCEQYAKSHFVIGIHGSNLLLPSAHAGITIDLMPDIRWGNASQDMIITETDIRLALLRYHMIPEKVTPDTLYKIIKHLFEGLSGQLLNYDDTRSDHRIDQSSPYRIRQNGENS